MINPKELRIGNIVDLLSEKEGVQIPSNQYKKIGQVGFFGVHLYEVNIPFASQVVPEGTPSNKICPIPITKEWFLKFGFVIDKSMGRGSIFEFAEKFTCHYFDYQDAKIWIEQYGEGEFPLRHIKHIHQLQNLYFALVGEELQIKEL